MNIKRDTDGKEKRIDSTQLDFWRDPETHLLPVAQKLISIFKII